MESGIVKNTDLKVICLIPSLPSEVRMETLTSIFNQTVPVVHTILLTERVKDSLSFPAKISLVLNNMLENLKLENYDYLLRVDADTILPPNFIEENIKSCCAVIGYGPAQLIEVKAFLKFMKGRMYPDHDDGYPIVKLKQDGLKTQVTYKVSPIIQRKSGFHQGTKWFIEQGELHFCYGTDVLSEFAVVMFKWKNYHPYGCFFLVGYFKALFQGKSYFDVAPTIIANHLLKFKQPLRLFRSEKVKRKIRGFKL
jgi:hypothetical protein